MITQIPEDADLKKKKICELIHNIYGLDIQITDILYDPASECLVLKEEVEQNMLKNIKPERAVEPDEIAKYTTLDTLVAVLQSGKIRMNSIVSMNDKTETGFWRNTLETTKKTLMKNVISICLQIKNSLLLLLHVLTILICGDCMGTMPVAYAWCLSA